MFAWVLTALLLLPAAQQAQAQAPAGQLSFEVAAIKKAEPWPNGSRFFRMESTNRFIVRTYPLKLLIAAAYDVNPKAILGGPAWIDTQRYDIDAVTPGDERPSREQQMLMLRSLLAERFQLTFHRQEKEFPIYLLTVAKGGPKLEDSGASPHDPSNVISTVYPGRIVMPAKNASMQDFTAVLQRAVLDRPVVDKTGLTGRYDFKLDWSPSGREFGGDIPAAPEGALMPPLFTAIQEQLGLKLQATHGMAEALVIDTVEQPSDN